MIPEGSIPKTRDIMDRMRRRALEIADQELPRVREEQRTGVKYQVADAVLQQIVTPKSIPDLIFQFGYSPSELKGCFGIKFKHGEERTAYIGLHEDLQAVYGGSQPINILPDNLQFMYQTLQTRMPSSI